MRLKTPIVKIGNINIGGENPIAIQSMTYADTCDISATVKQCIELADAGVELMRITVNNDSAAKAIPKIRSLLDEKGCKNLPIIGDFHFNGHKLLEENPLCAKVLDKYRINPGNVSFGEKKDENFEKIIKIAVKNKKPVRIGANSGSIDVRIKEKDPIKAIVKSVLDSAKYAEKLGLKRNKIVLSVKMSDVNSVIKANELLVQRMKKNKRIYAIHLGLTEAGSDIHGLISSTAALSILLNKGIGDTIRVSITPNEASNGKDKRTKEIEICQNILQSLRLRYFKPKTVSCPGCGRTDNKIFQKIVTEINGYIEKNWRKWVKTNPKIRKLHIAVMGCMVNGPGEAKTADIALHLPGKTEKAMALVYFKGKFLKTIKDGNISKEFIKIIEKEIKI